MTRGSLPAMDGGASENSAQGTNLDVVMQLPVQVRVVLGSATMPVATLAKLGRGSVVTLDRKVGDPVDIMVNGRLIARGEVVVLEEDGSRFGISLTEIVGSSSRMKAAAE